MILRCSVTLRTPPGKVAPGRRSARGVWIVLAACWAMLASVAPASPDLRPTRAGTSGPVADEHYGWRPVAIGGGGFITGQAIDPHGKTHVARTDVAGAYLWNADRDQWMQLATAATLPAPERDSDWVWGGVYEIAVAPSRPERLYMAMQKAVFRSDDRGQHFVRAWPQGVPLDLDANGPYRITGPFLAVSPRDPDLVLLSTQSDGVWRSEDGGVSWARLADIPAAPPETAAKTKGRPDLVWFTPDGSRAWIMAQGIGMVVSTDPAARTFAPLTKDGPSPQLLRRGGFDRHGVFRGADQEGHAVWQADGGRWTRYPVVSNGQEREVAAVVADPRDDGLYAFSPYGSVFRSGDNGASWWPVPTRIGGAPASEPSWLSALSFNNKLIVADVIPDPVVPGRLWASAGVGPFRADPPPGKLWLTWSSQARGIEELVATGVAHPPGGIPLFTAWDFGIHARADLDRFSTTWGPRPRVLIAAQDLAWSAGHPEALVTNATDTRECCFEDGETVLAGYSRDGGASWHRFPTLPVPPGTKPDDPKAMSYGTIAVSSGDPDNIIWEPAFDRSPFYTLDNGKSWQRVVLPGEVLPFTGSYERYPYVRRTLAADPVVPGRFLLFHSGLGANAALKGLWRTDDGGRHWTRIMAGDIAPANGYSAKLRAMPGVRDRWFFTNGQRGPGNNGLRHSRDGGMTWQTLDPVEQATDIAFGKAAAGHATPTIYIAGKISGRTGLWRSINDGATWQMIGERPLGRLTDLVAIGADPDHFGRVYVAYAGSGWLYGEPTPCRPVPIGRDTVSECVAVR